MAKVKVTKSPDRWVVYTRELDSLPVREVYQRLSDKLSLDAKHCKGATLRQHILEAPEDLRLAGYVYAVAKEERERLESAWDERMGEWVPETRKRIAGWKKGGQWEGQTTIGDVERVILKDCPGASELKEKVRKASKIERAARSLLDAFQSRLGALQTYARLLDRRPHISQEEFNASQRETRNNDNG